MGRSIRAGFVRLILLSTCVGFAISHVCCLQAGGINGIKTVFIIVMENRDWPTIQGDTTNAPYLNNTLLPMASYARQYFTPPGLHPSEPNYLWLEAGANFGIVDDGLPTTNRVNTTNHLVTLLDRAGVSWKAYPEGITGNDCPLLDNYPYTARHNPVLFFDDVTTHFDYCTNHVRPYSELADDLANNRAARYNLVIPNLTNDMHDWAPGSLSLLRQGDDWLARELPGILVSSAYTNGGALFIVWDEGDLYSDGPLGLIVLSPRARGNGYSNTNYYTHSSLLRTVHEIFGVRPFLGDAANAPDLSDLFVTLGISMAMNPAVNAAELTLTGLLPGRTNLLQTSTNLVDWTTLRTNVAVTDSLSVPGHTATHGDPHFYRVEELP